MRGCMRDAAMCDVYEGVHERVLRCALSGTWLAPGSPGPPPAAAKEMTMMQGQGASDSGTPAPKRSDAQLQQRPFCACIRPFVRTCTGEVTAPARATPRATARAPAAIQRCATAAIQRCAPAAVLCVHRGVGRTWKESRARKRDLSMTLMAGRGERGTVKGAGHKGRPMGGQGRWTRPRPRDKGGGQGQGTRPRPRDKAKGLGQGPCPLGRTP